MCVGRPFFLIKSFSPATRSAFIYMPQSLCRGKEALRVQAILTGFGGSSLLQDGCISQSWMHLPPQHSSGSSSDPTLWAGNRIPEGTKTGQTHRSPHFCQASPVPTAMTTAKHSRGPYHAEVLLTQFSSPRSAWDQSSSAHCLLRRRRRWGGKKKDRLLFFLVIISWLLFRWSINQEAPALIHRSISFL